MEKLPPILAENGIKGCQTPQLSNFPLFHTSIGEDAIDLAAVCGYDLHPWQQDLLIRSLGMTKNNRWACADVCLIVPRQNGKNVIVDARELAGLFLLGEQKILHTSQQMKTSRDAHKELSNRIMAVPDLAVQCLTPKYGNDDTSIRLKDKNGKEGAYIKYIARSPDSGRGFREVDLIICDEAYKLSDAEMNSLLPTQAANSNPQMWLTSSAGFDESLMLSQMRQVGKDHANDRLLYAEWTGDETTVMRDEREWARVNPSYGYHLSRDVVSREYYIQDEAGFARERLGLWELYRDDRAIPTEAWEATLDRFSAIDPKRGIAIGFETNADCTVGAIYVAGYNQDGLLAVERASVGLPDDSGVRLSPSEWIPEFISRQSRKFKIIDIVHDSRSTAASLMPELRARGVECRGLGWGEITTACGLFLNAVKDRTVRHRGDDLLDAAVANATKRFATQTSEQWAWDRADFTIDHTPLVACTLAAYALRGAQGPKKKGGRIW